VGLDGDLDRLSAAELTEVITHAYRLGHRSDVGTRLADGQEASSIRPSRIRAVGGRGDTDRLALIGSHGDHDGYDCPELPQLIPPSANIAAASLSAAGPPRSP